MADNIVEDSVSTVVTNLTHTYATNDICLTIYPYDNYKKISLYERVDGADKDYDIDRSECYKYYLEFGDSEKKKIKIEECTDYYTSNGSELKFASNELLFKITQKDAYSILALSSDVFNVVREIVSDNLTTEIQTMFVGRWAKAGDKDATDTSVLIQELKNRISELLSLNDALNSRLIDALKEVSDLTEENERLKEYEKYKDMYEELYNQTQQGDEYTGTAIEYDAKYIKVEIDDDELASQVNNYLDTLNT